MRTMLRLLLVFVVIAAFVPNSLKHLPRSKSKCVVEPFRKFGICKANHKRGSPRMMFNQLTENLSGIAQLLQGKKKITPASVERALVEVKRALLESDVNLKVTNDLIESVRRQAVGKILIEGVSPDQQFIKIMYDELVLTMGAQQAPLARSVVESEPVVVLLAGLQGAGKTTAAVKLAKYCQERGAGVEKDPQPTPKTEPTTLEDIAELEMKGPLTAEEKGKVLLIAGDVYRPAAIEQLQKMAEKISAEVYSEGQDANPVEIVKNGIAYGKEKMFDVIIVDTAGRQVIDDDLMDELVKVKEASKPNEILLVVDAMTGQEAASLTAAFNEKVEITGAILTKLDGDSRGGSALSVQSVSGKPIKFIGIGEKIDDLEPFYPDRMASRILGMGDVVSFVEKAQKQVSEAEMNRISKKMLDSTFDFNDFLEQSKVVRNMGSMANVAKMIPGIAGKINQSQIEEAEERAERAELFISFMLPEERSNPELLISDASTSQRHRRIAKAAGYRQKDVSSFISDFQKMKGMMSRMSKKMAAEGQNTAADDLGGNSASIVPNEQDMMAMGNRQQRRQAAKNSKKSGAAKKKGFGSK